jgi:hypothetical protein
MWPGTFIFAGQGYRPPSITASENIATRNVFLQEFGFLQLHLLGGT